MIDLNSKVEQRHKKKMQKQKDNIDAKIAAATQDQGVVIPVSYTHLTLPTKA